MLNTRHLLGYSQNCNENVILVLKNMIAKVANHLTASQLGYFCKTYIYIYIYICIYIFWYSSKIYSDTGKAYFSIYQQQPKESRSVSKLRRIGILVPRS